MSKITHTGEKTGTQIQITFMFSPEDRVESLTGKVGTVTWCALSREREKYYCVKLDGGGEEWFSEVKLKKK